MDTVYQIAQRTSTAERMVCERYMPNPAHPVENSG